MKLELLCTNYHANREPKLLELDVRFVVKTDDFSEALKRIDTLLSSGINIVKSDGSPRCIYCGVKQNEGAQTCTQCGAPL